MQTTLRSRHHDRKQGAYALGRAYGRFLELPPTVVLSVLWLTGLALLGSCVLTFYLYVSLLAGV
jgi:hypothetical protein